MIERRSRDELDDELCQQFRRWLEVLDPAIAAHLYSAVLNGRIASVPMLVRLATIVDEYVDACRMTKEARDLETALEGRYTIGEFLGMEAEEMLDQALAGDDADA